MTIQKAKLEKELAKAFEKFKVPMTDEFRNKIIRRRIYDDVFQSFEKILELELRELGQVEI